MKTSALGKVWVMGLLAAVGAFGACDPSKIVVVSPYDAATDAGFQEFKQKLNLLVVEASSKTGAEGSFDAYKKSYAELEVALLLLRQRVAVLEADDTKCDVSDKIKALLAKLPHGKDVLSATAAAAPPLADDKAPVPVTPVAIGKQKNLPPAVGCMTHLIDNVAGQLTSIETLHSDPRFCAAPGQPSQTCLRPATAVGALGPANDSLDAALLVLLYKKEGEAK